MNLIYKGTPLNSRPIKIVRFKRILSIKIKPVIFVMNQPPMTLYIITGRETRTGILKIYNKLY